MNQKIDTKQLIDTVIPQTGHVIDELDKPQTAEEKLQSVLSILAGYGQTDGAHHKDWCIDQAVRMITGDDYEYFVERYCGEQDHWGERMYSWDEGIAP